MRINAILLFLIITTFICSCSKEEKQVQATVDVELDFTEEEFDNFIAGENNKTWNVLNFKLANIVQGCRLDDSFFFNANKTYTYTGGELCGDEDDEEIKSGIWTVDADNNLVIFDQGTSTEFQAHITEASDTGIRLSPSLPKSPSPPSQRRPQRPSPIPAHCPP